MTDLYRTRWSNSIHEEWMEKVEQNYLDITRSQVERIRDLMNAHARDCLVVDFESLIPTLSLPDPDDRHVLAVAIHSGAEIIVTFNLRDFPDDILEPYGVAVIHPDEFILHLVELAPNVVCAAAKRHRESLKSPPKNVNAYLASLERQGLSQAVAALRQYADLI